LLQSPATSSLRTQEVTVGFCQPHPTARNPSCFKSMNKKLLVATSLAALQVTFQGLAQVVYGTNGSSYTQSFDSISSTTWANNSTITGWSLFNKTPAAITTIVIDNGSGNTGSFVSYGATGASDRALGGLGSGGTYFGSPASASVAGYIALQIQNSTGSALTQFTIGFSGEQWRNGGNATAQTMALQYGFGSTFAGVTTWNSPAGNFDWSSPVATVTAAAVNGNAAGSVTGRGGTVSNLNWADGTSLWIRWVENNDAGNDHGLAIDDVTFSAVPEPSEYAALAGAGLIGFAVWRRRSVRKA
jgi:hypothetical protein